MPRARASNPACIPVLVNGLQIGLQKVRPHRSESLFGNHSRGGRSAC